LRGTLEGSKELKMLTGCKVLKQNVMLWTDSKNLSEIVHFIKDTHSKDLCRSLACLNKTSKHRDSGGLSSAVVTQKCEYLPIIHGDIRVLNSDLGTEFTSESSDFEAFVCLLLTTKGFWDLFKVLRVLLLLKVYFFVRAIIEEAVLSVLFRLVHDSFICLL
jgi:hypothetical protein